LQRSQLACGETGRNGLVPCWNGTWNQTRNMEPLLTLVEALHSHVLGFCNHCGQTESYHQVRYTTIRHARVMSFVGTKHSIEGVSVTRVSSVDGRKSDDWKMLNAECWVLRRNQVSLEGIRFGQL